MSKLLILKVAKGFGMAGVTDLDECNKWRDDQSDAFGQKCRELITQRLPCSSWHAHEHIPVTCDHNKHTTNKPLYIRKHEEPRPRSY